MTKQEYTYTGNMPSGNPFTWYYDAAQRTSFGTSKDSQYWSKQPEIGDKLVYWKSGHYNEVTERVFINGEMVYKKSEKLTTLKKDREEEELRTLVSETRKRLGVE
jgi:hypothetical protein